MVKGILFVWIFMFILYAGLRATGNPERAGCGNISLFSSHADYKVTCGEEYTGKNKVVPSALENSRMSRQLDEWADTGYDSKYEPKAE